MSANRPANEDDPRCACIRVTDVMEILGISSTAAYNLVKQAAETQKPFRAISAGGIYLVLKDSFYQYVFGDQGGKPPSG